MLNLAKKNVKKDGFQTLLGKSEKIHLENNTADILVSRFSLTYWENPKDSFEEIKRILKPGGKLVLEALNKRFSKLRLFAIKSNMFFKGAGSDVIRYHSEAFNTAYDIREVEEFLRNAGMKIIYKEAKKNDWKFVLVSEKSI
jgi:ubiquinone/menaquinone biosynthesis C-methylase UbiE